MKKSLADIIEHSCKIQRTNHKTTCQSMLVSFFGDVLAVHGGVISLNSLVGMFKKFGYTEQTTRITIYRLQKDGWITSNRLGKNKFVSFSSVAYAQYHEISKRLYGSHQTTFENTWIVIFAPLLNNKKLYLLNSRLQWLGYCAILPRCYIRQSSNIKQIIEILDEYDLNDKTIVLSGTLEDITKHNLIFSVLPQKLQIQTLNKRYQQFINYYLPIADFIPKFAELKDTHHVQLRIFLLNDFRKIQLRDPCLPSSFLSSNWIGYRARQLFNRLYSATAKLSSEYISKTLRNEQGYLPEASIEFKQRLQ
ncbi:MAG: PaaX family transcriptional regulator C-terminal domain-containing protein [Methylacidiphilales bacterium]|nr:PaaX family transcriptional regulator C-terminal domain-containing protein [Candidatus Methylacidiphilales bacterium]